MLTLFQELSKNPKDLYYDRNFLPNNGIGGGVAAIRFNDIKIHKEIIK